MGMMGWFCTALFCSIRPSVTCVLGFIAEGWIVHTCLCLLQADFDMDNLRLADLDASLAVTEFELDALMLTGSCVDMTRSRMVSQGSGVMLLMVLTGLCVDMTHSCMLIGGSGVHISQPLTTRGLWL